jgi:hypothetical protein
MGVKSGHSSVEDALLIRTQFAGHDMGWKDLWRHRRRPGKEADVPEVIIEEVGDLMPEYKGQPILALGWHLVTDIQDASG